MCNFWKSILLLSFVSCLFLPLLFVRAEEKEIKFKPQVGIGTEFPAAKSKVIQERSPLIGQYIAALYRYFIGAIAIIATVMIMWGGFLWLTAAGSASQIGIAKSRITGALIGLVLALGSYLILNTINPKLVRFEPLTITPIERAKELEMPEIGGEGVVSCDLTPEKGGPTYEGKLFTLSGAKEVTEREAVMIWAAASVVTGGFIKGAIVAGGVKRSINWTIKEVGEAWVGGRTCESFCNSLGKYAKIAGSLKASKGGEQIEAICCACAEAKIKLDPDDPTLLTSAEKIFFCHPEFIRDVKGPPKPGERLFVRCGDKVKERCLGASCREEYKACVRTGSHEAECRSEITLKVKASEEEAGTPVKYSMKEEIEIGRRKSVYLPCGAILSVYLGVEKGTQQIIGTYCSEEKTCVIDPEGRQEKHPTQKLEGLTLHSYKVFKAARCL